MEQIIRVKDICDYAMFEIDGISVREKILEDWDKDASLIFILDFADITMFATMFFNASIGWFVLHKGMEETENRIQYINLSKLGEDTWIHSFENAIEVAKKPEYRKFLSEYDPDEE